MLKTDHYLGSLGLNLDSHSSLKFEGRFKNGLIGYNDFNFKNMISETLS